MMNQTSRPFRTYFLPGLLVTALVVTAVYAWSRVGLLNLPSISSQVTLEQAGLANLSKMRDIDVYIHGLDDDALIQHSDSATFTTSENLMREGLTAIRQGRLTEGVSLMERSVSSDPDHLVLANAYRMEIFQLKRSFLLRAKQSGILTPEFPNYLSGKPIEFLQRLLKQHESRETKLHLAFAWVDHMLLFPALEIKAPSSVESVELLSEIIEQGDGQYIPALFARGLNYLHRPARLVWPESHKMFPDAAAQDIGRCIAIGRKLGVGSKRLQATLAISLGDAYVKAGRLGVARSWWQIAQNISLDEDLQSSIHRRYGWQDEEILDRLEEELDRGRAALDQPMTDLAMMWN